MYEQFVPSDFVLETLCSPRLGKARPTVFKPYCEYKNKAFLRLARDEMIMDRRLSTEYLRQQTCSLTLFFTSLLLLYFFHIRGIGCCGSGKSPCTPPVFPDPCILPFPDCNACISFDCASCCSFCSFKFCLMFPAFG